MSKSRGRPPKRAKRNISGLRNQSRQQSTQQSLSDISGNSSDSNGDYSDSEGLDLTELDSLAFLEVDSDHDDSDNEADWDEVAKEEFQDRLFELLAQIEEDQRDAGDSDWIPSRKASEAKRAAEKRRPGGRPKEYMKGPDTASKKLRTQQRYAKANRTQSKLDNFFVEPAQSSLTAASSSTTQERESETFLENEVQYLADTKQNDTVIPHSNPSVEQRGMVQKMTTDDGEAKGLQAVLVERGFNVSGLKAKCSPVAAWRACSANRKTLLTSHQCLRQ
ncbi:hypothetical protein K438DRAFT_1786203 [Mycena galopus ATCC 62051]|nr:hypothetical protein K438DRAFT_1786203 [Mycena galopus ATCC 62051]